MTSRDFCYWLQGCLEVGQLKELDEKQTEIVKRHLNMVFKHEIDPSMGDEAHQEELRQIHEGGTENKKPKEVHHHHHHDREDRKIMC